MKIHLLFKRGLVRVPFLFFFFTFAVSLEAVSVGPSKSLEVLAESKEWKSLLRYERPLLYPWSYDSAVQDNDFFLSSQGSSDPLEEMKATIEAFNHPLEKFKNQNKHALCRFPARYRWLKEKLVIKDYDNQLRYCSDYQRWNESGQVSSISLYFATGYFGNPASFFGHPLLKFNREDKKSEFIDTSLNYGAMTPANENPILYVLKGLLGGYTASFTRHDFFYHNHNYSETEMRDLWEYRLNLDPKQVQAVVDRTWELLGKNHPYYFLVDNCAYRMAELLEDIFGKPLFFRNRLYVIPIDIFDNLAKGKRHDGQPMVSSVKMTPSRYTRLAKRYSSLSSKEKDIVKAVIKNKKKDLGQGFLGDFSAKSRARIFETLISYYSFRKLRGKENQSIEASRVAMIRERFKVKGKSGFRSLSYGDVLPPHESVNSFGLGLTQGYGDILGSFQELTIRPALYDELNPSIARPSNTSLEVFKTQVRLREGDIELRSMELFRISTIDSSQINLPKTGSMSWKVRLGIRSQAQSCQTCQVVFTEGGIGSSLNLWKGAQAYGLIKAGLQNNRNRQGTLYALPEIGVYTRILKNWKAFASYEYEKFFNGLETNFDIWTLESRFGSSKWWDLRLKYKKRDDEQVSVSLWFYL